MSRFAVCTLLALTGIAHHTHAQSIASLWENNCASCHGDRGQGGGAGTKTLLTNDKRDPALDRVFFDVIKTGKAETGMTAFGETLKNEQIWGLVNHIRELQDRAYRRSGGGPKVSPAGVSTTQHATFKVETIIDDGLETPWSVNFLPSGEVLITERPGRLRVWKGGKLSRPVAGIPESVEMGQGGLMDVSPHPDFGTNRIIYLAINEPIANHPGKQDGHRGAMTAVVRGKLDKDCTTFTLDTVVWRARPEHYSRSGVHFGCRFVWGKQHEGKHELFFCIGERGTGMPAQDLDTPYGKVYRIWDDGSIPSDNPFASNPEPYNAVYSYGHRNPQGLVRDLAGNLWDTEHGPRGGDELNLVLPGKNYGWPIISFGINYNGSPLVTPWAETAGDKAKDKEFTMPVDRWLPSVGVCGLDVSTGGVFAAWKGDLLAGGLSGQSLDRFRLVEKDGIWTVAEREELVRGLGRVRDVRVGPDGAVWLALNGPDHIVRLAPASKPVGE